MTKWLEIIRAQDLDAQITELREASTQDMQALMIGGLPYERILILSKSLHTATQEEIDSIPLWALIDMESAAMHLGQKSLVNIAHDAILRNLEAQIESKNPSKSLSLESSLSGAKIL